MQNVSQQLEDFIGRLEALEGKSDTVCVPLCFFPGITRETFGMLFFFSSHQEIDSENMFP